MRYLLAVALFFIASISPGAEWTLTDDDLADRATPPVASETPSPPSPADTALESSCPSDTPLTDALTPEQILIDLAILGLGNRFSQFKDGWQNEEWEECEKALKVALETEKDPDRRAACEGAKGVFYATLRKLSNAEQAIRRAAELRPVDPLFPSLLAWVLMDGVRYDEAESAIEQARDIDRGYTFGRIQRARLLTIQDDLPRATDEWRRVRIDAPDLELARVELKRLDLESHIAENSKEYSTAHFRVRYESAIEDDDPEAIKAILADMDMARAIIDKELRHDPPVKILALVYTEETFQRYMGSDAILGLFYPYDGSMRLRYSAGPAGRRTFRQLVFHEYLHAALHSLTGGRLTERWAHEGMAMWAESLGGPDPLSMFSEGDLREIGRHIPPISVLKVRNYGHYIQAAIVIRVAMQRFGRDRWISVFTAMGESRNLDEAMTATLGYDLFNVQKLLRNSLR